MPMIDLTLTHGALDDERQQTLASELADVVSKWTGMPEDSPAMGALWTFVDERPAGSITTGRGRVPSAALYRVQVTVASGVLDQERKQRLIAEVTRRVLEAEGSTDDPRAAGRVLCHIHELPEGNWGSAGRAWGLAEIAEFAGIDAETVPGLAEPRPQGV